jgi:hypothetical protein
MPADYAIHVRGSLGPEMRHALADLCPEPLAGHTRLSAHDIDQAQLHGILWRLRTLAVEIDAVWRTGAEPIDGGRGPARSKLPTMGDSPDSPTWAIAAIERND